MPRAARASLLFTETLRELCDLCGFRILKSVLTAEDAEIADKN